MTNDPGKRRALMRAMQQAAMAEVMAMAAHEVNQPLAAMVANAGAGLRWLGREPADVEEARAAFQRIADDGRRAGDLLRRIRAQATGDYGAESLLSVGTLVDEAWITAGEMARVDAIKLERRVPPELTVRCDPAALQLVMVNLILNAVEAMQAEGALSIEASQPEAGRVAIAVRDTGPGFPAGDAERLFQPFYSATGGVGMGLTVSRAIAEAHGGNLEARREPGLTTFTLLLPTAPRAR